MPPGERSNLQARRQIHHLLPPGYTGRRPFGNILRSGDHGAIDRWEMFFQQLLDEKWAIVGSPESVIESLGEFTDELGGRRGALRGLGRNAAVGSGGGVCGGIEPNSSRTKSATGHCHGRRLRNHCMCSGRP
jgi:hypothetical protein